MCCINIDQYFFISNFFVILDADLKNLSGVCQNCTLITFFLMKCW